MVLYRNKKKSIFYAIIEELYHQMVFGIKWIGQIIWTSFQSLIQWFSPKDSKKSSSVLTDLKNSTPHSSVQPLLPKQTAIQFPAIELGTTPVVITEKIIDNPGQGDCLFFALALDLVRIIHYEKLSSHVEVAQRTFNIWKKWDPTIQYEDLMKFTYQELTIHRFQKDSEAYQLWNKLQYSLRRVLGSYQIHRLLPLVENASQSITPDTILSNNRHYLDFRSLYFHSLDDSRYNVFANHSDIHKAIDYIKRLNLPLGNELNQALAQHFMMLFTQNPSPIFEAILRHSTTEWGTDEDLVELSEVFDVNVQLKQNQPSALNDEVEVQNAVIPRPRPNRHSFWVKNINNFHWVNVVPDVEDDLHYKIR